DAQGTEKSRPSQTRSNCCNQIASCPSEIVLTHYDGPRGEHHKPTEHSSVDCGQPCERRHRWPRHRRSRGRRARQAAECQPLTLKRAALSVRRHAGRGTHDVLSSCRQAEEQPREESCRYGFATVCDCPGGTGDPPHYERSLCAGMVMVVWPRFL